MVIEPQEGATPERARRPEGPDGGGPIGPPELEGILETVLYYDEHEEVEVESFYRDILGLRPIGKKVGRFLFFRIGSSVLLLFNVEASLKQKSPPPHGTFGPGHACFVVSRDAYGLWKEHLARSAVPTGEEIEWPRGGRSFYFYDPSGNQLEIADRDIWPE